ncbi:ABC transporter permease [Fulvivirgaceae bacterium PWU4]|uniref:ABC transporter permease n=1 Tax=Chryseosolibacter histidini TaxID=2782349 RepID=A0AAP2GKC4_9BACT|nr:ABC transporter permease [Chryseosolibacter histidini]MBT1698904.1 ABC transporter permease [Chryseosolibacter histidini]
MNKIWLIFQREFLNRVQKKSFLIATILIPLVFPLIIGVMIYVAVEQEKSAGVQTVEVLDKSGKIQLQSNDRYNYVIKSGELDDAKNAFSKSKSFALLYIPPFDLAKPEGITLYTKENPSIRKIEELEGVLETKIHDLKLEQFNIDKEILKGLKTNISLNNVNLSESGEEKESNIGILYGLGFFLGILIYMFVLIYGMQIMLGVIEEKTSKIVEVIVSSVKPFQLMMGKILGIAAVGLLQFTIWVILITVLSTGTLALFGLKMPQQQAMEQVSKQMQQNEEVAQEMQNSKVAKLLNSADQIPFASIIFNFAFYFLGGYLLYGALFAAVGSAVDSQQEAQQFTFPLTLPLIIGYFGLFMFILNDPNSPASFWFSIIPFTSPVAMVGRLAFGVPLWQLILSQVLLIGGFIFTTWIAARIYRVGILMHGSKVNYKVLVKWFMQKG